MKTKINKKEAKCFNCISSRNAFKLGKVTHIHCQNSVREAELVKGALSPFDTLQEFYNSCNHHTHKHQYPTNPKNI